MQTLFSNLKEMPDHITHLHGDDGVASSGLQICIDDIERMLYTVMLVTVTVVNVCGSDGGYGA
ncbi:hypothetical protein Hanom_Chr17g01569571 [Helianthus anomalus]